VPRAEADPRAQVADVERLAVERQAPAAVARPLQALAVEGKRPRLVEGQQHPGAVRVHGVGREAARPGLADERRRRQGFPLPGAQVP
jgi:hypothetical protein